MANKNSDVTVVRDEKGTPHAGKVFAAVHAHQSDVPRHAAGLCAKLIAEGYTGYLIRTTNDEKSGGQSIAQNILSNEQEHLKMAAGLGFKDVFDLYYRSHFMDGISKVEIQSRLVLLFRMLKADTVISYNPSMQGEEDSDQRQTAAAVQEAASLAGQDYDFHEHFEAGIQPQPVSEQYYMCLGPDHSFNRVVDISTYIGKKVDAIAACRSQGGNLGSLLRTRLAGEGKRLPVLGGDDLTANREYVRNFVLDDLRQNDASLRVRHAERFFYVDQRPHSKSKLDEYIQQHAVPL